MGGVYDKYYERQPPAVKIIVAAGVGLLGYSIYRSVKQKQEEREALKGTEEAANELNTLAANGVVPSYSDSQFYVFVGALTSAMNGCGTDEEGVYTVFRNMNNEADIRKLITTFAIQYYEPCAFESPISYAIWQLNDKAYGGDLAAWLHFDLDEDEINEVNNILQSRGIAYKF